MKKLNKKKIIILVSIVALVILTIIGIIVFIKSRKPKPENELKKYFSYIEEQKYEEMYNTISTKSKQEISKEDFIKRNKNIYEGIEATNISIDILETTKKEDKTVIKYNLNMYTLAGKVSFENTATIVQEEKEYKLNWLSKDIFPKLTSDDKVKAKSVTSKRGKILDRNGIMLAGEGIASSVGIVPGKMSENKEQDISKISELLGIPQENIKKQINASYVKEDTFVPIKTVTKDATELKENLLKIKGIKIIDTKTRIYPYGQKTSHLLGYVQQISAEELKELEQEGYSSNSIIGKSGIEKQYEDKLRGIDGTEIIIVDNKGNTKQTIAQTELKDGEDVKLTIDVKLQAKIYDQFSKDKSTHVAMNYKTGEILALVSTPTFNSNDFTLGMSTNTWNALKEDEQKPLYNRFLATYAPGSSFKPVIGAIGIDTNSLNPEENFGRSGTSWQKDTSWGPYKVTTLKEYGDTVNLRTALINSDNIYFAKVALKIGAQNLADNLLKIGFDESLPIRITTSKSTFGQSSKIEKETELADTGYGQGKVLVNPIHMASIYTAFLNNGNMLLPNIEYKENAEAQIWKNNAFKESTSNEIKSDLIQIVEDENGTAHSVKISGKTIGGKTGTAEIKDSKEDENGTELGWFNSFCEDKNLLIISMVEDVKDRGGSHYLLPKIKAIYQ